jgi:hypothetical protein
LRQKKKEKYIKKAIIAASSKESKQLESPKSDSFKLNIKDKQQIEIKVLKWQAKEDRLQQKMKKLREKQKLLD